MALSAARKQCQCSPSCPATIRHDSSWRYARGHSPAAEKKHGGTERKPASFVAQSGSYYSACLAILEKERDLLTQEIDRLEGQAVSAEKIAHAARELASDAATKHEVIGATITNLNLLLGIIPREG